MMNVLKLTLGTLSWRRFIVLGIMLLGISIAIGLVLYALKQNINLFYSPTEVLEGQAPERYVFRLGGIVKKDTLRRQKDLSMNFILTDYVSDIKVIYRGILPDLFREGQGVVAKGRLQKDGVFIAEEVLARHDENYMPKEASYALKNAHEIRQEIQEESS